MCFHNFFQMFAVNRSIPFFQAESSNRMLDCNIWLKTLSFPLRTDHLVNEAKSKRNIIICIIDVSSRWQVMAALVLVSHLGICRGSMTHRHDLGLCQHMQPAEQPTEPYPVLLHSALCHHCPRLPAMVAELCSHPPVRAPAPLVNAIGQEHLPRLVLAFAVPQSDLRRSLTGCRLSQTNATALRPWSAS